MRNLCQTDPIVYQDLPGGIKAGPEIYIYIDTTIVIFQAGHEICIDTTIIIYQRHYISHLTKLVIMKGKQISLSVFYDCMMAYNMLKLENTVSGYKPHVSHTNP
jgi:hypothetical protein